MNKSDFSLLFKLAMYLSREVPILVLQVNVSRSSLNEIIITHYIASYFLFADLIT